MALILRTLDQDLIEYWTDMSCTVLYKDINLGTACVYLD